MTEDCCQGFGSTDDERESILRLIWERDYGANEEIYDELARE